MRLLIALVLFATASAARAETAMIAVATNFLTVAEDLAADFANSSGHQIVLVGGATGKLAAQIANGAPFDAFLSADAATPERLVDSGLAEASSLFTFAIGRLLLWTSDPEVAPDPETILTAARHVAIANPNLAPYGLAAVQTIEHLGLGPLVADKIVQGENIGQTFALVHSGAAEAGFVAASSVMPEPPAGTIWPVPDEAHDPIRQDALLLAHGKENAAAIGFLAYLTSAQAKADIAAAGYGTWP
ncbi:molybdate ABC transporter substrate-binding protein [Defluviimonas sp. WL0002]|uniref:Molybdate ABC transporter substrate-binding protein n=1 Tax=Albidovulum marisflavi TaxID=2984159 RepID=A0ABT2ZEY6_9RHOB|nr:molybdate ABC transporter substrate-binding protein [Defluviimonas sp. WL0002]MCV2869667.1 molybdate ABC transporter substrate-binding protein [Defluviimonas sp. WL0002]